MARKITAATLPQPERHTRTQAAKTTTTLENTKTRPLTVQQKIAEQERAAPKADPAPKPTETLPAPTNPAAPTTPVDPEAFRQKLEQWSSMPLINFSFNGNDGNYPSTDGEIPIGSEFVALIPQASQGYIRFNGQGEQPTIVMSCISDSTPEITRDELGETNMEEWEPGLDGHPRDPWQLQIYLPLIGRGNGGDLHNFVARNAVSLIAVRQLFGRYRYHPKGRAGLYPVIKLGVVSYFNKRFNVEKPKPVLGIVDWVMPDGTPPTSNSPPKASDELDDSIPF